MFHSQFAMFGAGCFWGVEAAFRRVPGVVATAVGYAGGVTPSPTYEQVCSGGTGHVEVVQVEFDPLRVTYDELLAVFWTTHDPTQVGGQGYDIGTQYRSVVFAHDAEQQRMAEESRRRLLLSGRAIASRIEPAPTFWRAEEYHQQYLDKRALGTCGVG